VDLLERDEPRDALAARLAEARSGHGSLTLVAGEAGIGKTSLVRGFCTDHAGEARVLRGWCDALSTPRPLGPIDDLAREAGGDLARVVHEGAGRYERFTAFLDTLTSPSAPVVVVIEDVHWADEATLDLLVFVARRMAQSNGCVIATYRDDELGPDHPLRRVLGNLVRLETVHRLRLEPLSADAVSRLAAPHGVDPVWLYRITGGNPYFVVELLAAESGGDVPESVRDTVLARVARLTPAARSTLNLLAVMPDRVDIDVIRHAMGDTDGIDECEHAGLVIASGTTVAFRHELARLAVERAIPATAVPELHRGALSSLAAMPEPDLARLAYHAGRAGDAEAVLKYCPVAAEQAARMGAYGAARSHCEVALRFADRLPPPRRAALHELSGTASARAGLIDEAIEAYERAEAAWREAEDLDRAGAAMATRGQYLWAAGRASEAHKVTSDSIVMLENRPPGPGLVAAYTYGAYLRMLSRDRPGAIDLGTRAIGLAERHGDLAMLSKALNVVDTSMWTIDPDRASAMMERSLAAAYESGDDQTIGLALGNWGSAAIEVRRYAEGDHRTQQDIEWCSGRDLDIGRDYSRAWLARSAFEQGDWSRAESIVDDLANREYGNVSTRTIALTVRGLLAVRRGDADGEALLAEAWRLALQAEDPPRMWPVAAGLAESAWLCGRTERIADLIGETYQLACDLKEPWAIGELGYWLWRAGGLSGPVPGMALPYALHVGGDWAGAARAWDSIGCPYEAAAARADSDDTDQLIAALQTFHRLGARPAANLVRRRLRGRGVLRPPRGPHRATLANPAGLTGRQLEVLRLLAAGLSNADIAGRLHISRRTADHHVAAILAKLGVASRHDAARVARDWAALGGPVER